MKVASQIFAALLVAGLLIMLAAARPAYLSNITYLGGLLILEAVLAAVWHYEKWFFVILMVTFLWAGSTLPLTSVPLAARWLFLIVGAFVGVMKWGAKREKQGLSAIHLLGFLCVVSALVSSMVSGRVQLSLMKTLSLFLLFLYVSGGARVAVADREEPFFRGLVTAAETLSFFAGFCYLLLGFAIFGNPNSLGAIMGVAIVPILSWGLLIPQDRFTRHRRTVALCVAGYLLVNSASRAGLLAAGITLTVLCLSLRRGAMLLKAALAMAFLITVIGVVQPQKFDLLVSSFTEQVIYKGKVEQGLLGSRKSPWQDTVAVIKESPWFGSGFGTDTIPGQVVADSTFRTTEGGSREHGSSYMALLQYVGLLGAVPFAALLLLIGSQVYRTCTVMRRTGEARNYAIPLAMLCLAGLLHAVFEDWLFAAGYYLSVLFWASAFLLSDFLPGRSREAPVVHRFMRGAAANDSPLAAFAGK